MKHTVATTLSVLGSLGAPDPHTEHPFALPDRKWRFDYCWPDLPGIYPGVAWEIDGGAFTQGRHTRGKGFSEDIVKLNEAALRGWLVIRSTTAQVASGQALAWLVRALGLEEQKP